MIGGISCPPVDAAASTPPAKRPRKPLDFMSGMVITPGEAVLATADPLMGPVKAEDKTATNRVTRFMKESGSCTPHGVGSIIVSMHDCYYHKTKIAQHLPFVISDPEEVMITIDKPTVIVEFTKEEPNVSEFTRTWLNQIEDGLIQSIHFLSLNTRTYCGIILEKLE